MNPDPVCELPTRAKRSLEPQKCMMCGKEFRFESFEQMNEMRSPAAVAREKERSKEEQDLSENPCTEALCDEGMIKGMLAKHAPKEKEKLPDGFRHLEIGADEVLIIETTKSLTEGERKALKSEFARLFAGISHADAIVLPAGCTITGAVKKEKTMVMGVTFAESSFKPEATDLHAEDDENNPSA